MCPLELTATPVASPKFMSGGSLMKFGTESNLSSGADVDCASAEVESRPNRTVNQGFMRILPLRGGFDATNVRLNRSIQTEGPATQSPRATIAAAVATLAAGMAQARPDTGRSFDPPADSISWATRTGAGK